MFLKYVAVLLLIIARDAIAQNCRLNATHMDKRWVYAIRPTPNTWDILRTDFLEDRQKLYLICNAQSAHIELQCAGGRLPPIPAKADCSRRMKAAVVPLANSDNKCSRLQGDVFQIRYTMPDGSFVRLYEVCYSRTNERAVYAHHMAYGFNMPASNYQRPQFTLNNVVSRERADSFELRHVYNRFDTLLGSGQQYVKSAKLEDRILDRGHLVNSQDFLTYDQMDETFKYVNVMPQFRGVNRSNWKRVENWIHSLPATTKYAEVITGTYGVLALPHSQMRVRIPIYLMDINRNPLPMWMYKVVKYNEACYAFATFNNQFGNSSSSSNSLCPAVVCPASLKLSSDVGSGETHCCDYAQLVHKVGQHAALC